MRRRRSSNDVSDGDNPEIQVQGLGFKVHVRVYPC